MFSSYLVISAICLFMGVLFIVAVYVEKMAKQGRNLACNPWIYTLSLAVYCTTWTFYGSIGKASSSGMIFITIYLGATLMIALGWRVWRRLVRIKSEFHITSIADLISARYD